MSQVAELEQQKRNYKELVDRREMAERLSRNRDFKKLILEEFCVNECARYAQNSANPALSQESREDCLNIAQAAGHLKRFLSVVMQMGNSAARELDQIDDAIDQARLEDEAGPIDADEIEGEDD